MHLAQDDLKLSIAEADLEILIPLPFISQVLGLHVWAITLGFMWAHEHVHAKQMVYTTSLAPQKSLFLIQARNCIYANSQGVLD